MCVDECMHAYACMHVCMHVSVRMLDVNVSAHVCACVTVYCVEQETCSQSKNHLWFKFHAGQITASLLKRVCKTDPNKPSKSLVKQICYPELVEFTSQATQWVCSHEKVALNFYTSKMGVHHGNVRVEDCGFYLSHQFPHIGASPDAIVQCDCCGKGYIEIKCPYCTRQ